MTVAVASLVSVAFIVKRWRNRKTVHETSSATVERTVRSFNFVLNRPFLGEKKEQWRFAKKRRLALWVICQQGLVSAKAEAVAGLS